MKIIIEKIKNNILNLRPYSWIDLIFLGYLAKFSIIKNLIFSYIDLVFIISLLLWWFLFNSALETKHNYAYRGKTSLLQPIIFFILVTVIALIYQPLSLIPLLISIFLILVYLQKNKNKILGILSSVIRGSIETFSFFFVAILLNHSITGDQWFLGFIIFLLYVSRALIGDIRDVKHNKEVNKQTVPVVFGINISKSLITIILTFSCIVSTLYFGNYLLTLPSILFISALVFFQNRYVLHQLSIITTMFFHINLITFFTNQNLLLPNIIYIGLFLNFITYPLLKRKSNPIFLEGQN